MKSSSPVVTFGGFNPSRPCSRSNQPARAVIEKYKANMRRRFHPLAREPGAREPDALGDSLMRLWEGAYLTGITTGAHGPGQRAAKAARALIAAYAD
jgi:hypothetical protein